MAKNYTYAEAVAIIAEGKDMEAIVDLGRRYPALVQKTTVVATKAGQDFVELMSFMPEYLTANKVNGGIKKAISADVDTDDENENEDTETEGAAEESNDVDYDSMGAKQLWDILGKAGKRNTAKSKKKDDLLAAVKAMNSDADEADEEETDDEEETNKYEGKSAVELFKECKTRKIKAEPKKPAKYYVDLLTKADAAADEADEEEAEENWEEEKEETKKPAKKAADKKAPAKAAKPAKDEDGDDWDI